MTPRPALPAPDPQRVAERLLHTSAHHSFDPAEDVDWRTPLVDDAWFLQPERVSLYGTPLWEEMDHHQRLELSRQELARLLDLGAWFEQCVIQMFARYVAHRGPSDSRSRYALTEIADETRHMMMFGRLTRTLGCRRYRPTPAVRHLFPLVSPFYGEIDTFALALIIEEVLDRMQREAMRDERVQPLVRQVFRIHVIEEARHVSFAHTELQHALRDVSPARRAVHREFVAVAAWLTLNCLRHPGVYREAGLDPAVARRQARDNPYYRETLLWAGEKLVGFLTEVGMIGPAERLWWRRAGVMR
ncbi:diiron oxygenase [Streptomyces sp. ISL-11]|uniref:AurF N-oxygenase family protein n=1 Tax=Streptomyces sp. ISL-11 TaxID=2819174 RepID=UPI001BE89F70|nr:diiron oxygenase [Streptomyces sp. ISL-11]MBT2383307.1 diiron oxygenase [Streptomyces sp. ISL-11]